MKYIKLILSLFICLLIVKESFTQNKQKKKSVIVNVTFCNSYCGGAKPTENILEQYKKEYIFSNSSFILKKDSTNKQIKVTTNSKGVFTTALAPGKYNYYMTNQFNKKAGSTFNPDCDIWLNRSFGQIEILPQTKKYKIVYNFGCNPCEPLRP
jgi:hypothetical protein